MKCFRLWELREKPSIFQVKEEKIVEDKEVAEGVQEEASTARADLSDLGSLTNVVETEIQEILEYILLPRQWSRQDDDH